jgi:hypothetical protein
MVMPMRRVSFDGDRATRDDTFARALTTPGNQRLTEG